MTQARDGGGNADQPKDRHNLLVNLLAQKIAGTWSSSAGAVIGGKRRGCAHRWLTAYFQTHGVPPKGTHDLGHTGFHDIRVGLIDFDKLMRDREIVRLLYPPERDSEAVPEYPRCPVCSSNCGCEHLVALIDFQFCDIQAGFLYDVEEPLESCILDALQAAHEKKDQQPPFHRSNRLMKLYLASSFEQNSEGCEVSIPPAPLSRLLTNLLRDCGATGSVRELNQGPGWATNVIELFAENPDTVTQNCRQLLRAELDGLDARGLTQSNS